MSVSYDSMSLTKHNRTVFLSSFDPQDDIYVSVNIPEIDINILGENNLDSSSPENLYITDENGFPEGKNIGADIDSYNFYRDGIVFFLIDSDADPAGHGIDTLMTHGSAGDGLGLLSPTDHLETTSVNMSGHIASIAVDLSGGYCLSTKFRDVSTGLAQRSPKSITLRVSGDTTYQHLTTKVLDESELFNFNTKNKNIRVRFSNNLTTYQLDYRNDIFNEYTNVFTFNTGLDPSIIPYRVKFGIAYSGKLRLPVKDVTFSGTVSG
jgi:hypothetical protein